MGHATASLALYRTICAQSMLFGEFVRVEQDDRANENESPTWPLQIGISIDLAFIALELHAHEKSKVNVFEH